MNENTSKFIFKINVFLHCSIFSIPRIPNNVCKWSIGMLDAGMSTDTKYSHTISNDRKHRQEAPTTCHVVDVTCYNATMRGQDRYIMNMHLRNRFHTATTTAANTPGLRKNRSSAQTVRNRPRENGLRPYVRCVLMQHHHQNRLN